MTVLGEAAGEHVQHRLVVEFIVLLTKILYDLDMVCVQQQGLVGQFLVFGHLGDHAGSLVLRQILNGREITEHLALTWSA